MVLKVITWWRDNELKAVLLKNQIACPLINSLSSTLKDDNGNDAWKRKKLCYLKKASLFSLSLEQIEMLHWTPNQLDPKTVSSSSWSLWNIMWEFVQKASCFFVLASNSPDPFVKSSCSTSSPLTLKIMHIFVEIVCLFCTASLLNLWTRYHRPTLHWPMN